MVGRTNNGLTSEVLFCCRSMWKMPKENWKWWFLFSSNLSLWLQNLFIF